MTQADIQAALTAQGYTEARAAALDETAADAEITERGELLFAQLTQIQAEVQKIQEERTSQLRAILDTKQKIKAIPAKRQKKV